MEEPFEVTIIESKQSDIVFHIEPDWMTILEDQYIIQGQHLLYKFADESATVSEFGSEVDISVDMRRASAFAKVQQDDNGFNFKVNGNNVTSEHVGVWRINVKASYTDPKGREQTFNKPFYLHIAEDPNAVKPDLAMIEEPVSDDLTLKSESFEGVVKFEP